jgi:WD40 repeat protein
VLPKGIVEPWILFPDGKTVAGVQQDGKTIGLWEAATGKLLAQLAGHRGKVTCLAIHAAGQLLVSGSEDGTALVWDVKK